MDQDFHNQIATLSITHFNNLPKKGKPNRSEWTVLSSIVKENKRLKHFEVVALGTGSKCIGRTKMSPKGDIVNDSHAEVICRRAFLRYIYAELNAKNPDLFKFDSKCSLNDWIHFHFFTSHVPCGDAAIFTKQDPADFGDVLVVAPKRRKIEEDIYRTGAKCLAEGEAQDSHGGGAEYHTLGAVRTKPGRGDPTLSVSCSDKLAKWCRVGLQGALLAYVLKEPIFLSSFTVASQSPFSEESLRRALYQRFSADEVPPRMSLGQASIAFDFCKTDCKIACPASIVWFKFGALEVAVDGLKQGVTKKNRGAKAARLQISKVELFRTFLRTVHVLFGDSVDGVFYDEAKAKAVDYQRAWSLLKKEGFKCWTIKDKHLQHFIID